MRFHGRPLHYILIDGKPVPEDDVEKMAAFFEDFANRLVREDFFIYKNRGLVVVDRKTYEGATEHSSPLTEPNAEQLEHNRKAKKKKAELKGIPIKLSTIFLCIDHNHAGVGRPILWETMMFEEDHRAFGEHRYDSAKKALAGHLLVLQTLMSLAKAGKLERLLGREGRASGSGTGGMQS